jgi:cation:H+ antiporter
MAAALTQFVALAAVIVVAGTMLTRCADAVAEITGWGRLVVGSVLLAAATSLPELTVGLSAMRLGLPDLAVGNLLGACLMNLLLLAIMDLTHHSRGKMLSRESAAHALGGTQSITLIALVGIGISTAQLAPQAQWLGAHASVWGLVVAYWLGLRTVYIDQRVALRKAVEDEAQVVLSAPRRPLATYLAGFAAAAAIIVLAGPQLAKVAGTIAEATGLGDSFVGTAFVSICTTLPELVASYTAVRIGAFDLVIGNVFGSNAFNMLLFLPLDMAYPGALFASVQPAHVVSALGAIVASGIVIMGQLYQVETRMHLLEPDAWLVILIVVGALFLVYAGS